MGLDCYVMTLANIMDSDKSPSEIWYGRKENEIHGWMQNYSGIPADEFNCVNLPLTWELLDDFEKSMNASLVHTPGFFFGNAGEPDQVKEAARELLTAARFALSQDQEPYYTSWW